MESLGGSSRRSAQNLPRPQTADANIPGRSLQQAAVSIAFPAASSSGQGHSLHVIRPVSPGAVRPLALTPARDPSAEKLYFNSPASTAARDTQPERPQSAPSGIRVSAQVSTAQGEPQRAFGRVSLYDHNHEFLGAKVLRDLPYTIRTSYHSPDEYLTKNGGQDLKTRNSLAKWMKRHPRGCEPPFQLGNAGVTLSWESAPQARSIFRYLYDNGTIDFVTMRWGGIQNHIEWGRCVRRGCMSWSPKPYEVAVAKWLPIFMEGIREYEEPYRFLAIRGSESLILDAGADLHKAAADCVPPIRKALESREPTAVAVALELMLLSLRVDPKVAEIWIYELWQFAQVLNLFVQRKFVVNLGYNSNEISSLRQLVFDIVILLEENGGEHATTLIRRYCRVDPAVTKASQARRAEKENARKPFKPFKPFTLF